MKLIEKLAQDTMKAEFQKGNLLRNPSNNWVEIAFMDGFMLGFQKARGMAVEMINERMPVDAAILIEDLGESEAE